MKISVNSEVKNLMVELTRKLFVAQGPFPIWFNEFLQVIIVGSPQTTEFNVSNPINTLR